MSVAHALEGAMAAAVDRHRCGDFEAAESMYRQVLRSEPEQPDALHLMGLLAFQTDRLADSIYFFRRALAVRPMFANAWHSLAKALHLQGRADEASVAYRRAISLANDYVEAYCDYATLLAERGQVDEAIAAYQDALSHKPEFVLAQYNLSLLLLLKGDYQQGFRMHESRWRASELGLIQRNFTQPQWRGEPLNGRRILLHCEQGFGDAIQFIRYAPHVAERGGKVIIECHAALKSLFSNIVGVDQVIVEDSPLPPFDLHCPLHSLPLAMGTTVETIPSHIPYLHADLQRAEQWKTCTNSDSGTLKVGLVWAGRSTHDNDRNRSLNLKDLEPLTHIAGVSLYSLQKGQRNSRTDPAAHRIALIDHTDELNDFSDTAALIANLDLVITVDTSVAHLAGAMGKPTWVLLPFLPDWRWMLERSDSPWYSTVRLFRQSKIGDWKSPIEEVLQALHHAVDAIQNGESYGQGDLSQHPTPSRTTTRRISRPLVDQPEKPKMDGGNKLPTAPKNGYVN